MASGDDPDRLRALESRIAALKRKQAPRPAAVTGFSQGEAAWRMVLELVTGMLIGLSLGYGLDVLFGTLPIFLIVFVLLGFAAGIKVMLGTAAEMAKTAAAAAAAEQGKNDNG